MNMKTVKTVLALLFMFLLLSVAINTHIVNAQQQKNITVNSDGTISPATAPILQVGDTYKVTANLYNTSLIIQKNNISLDGQGFSLQGPGADSSQAGISLKCSNATVSHFYVSGWGVGVLGVFDNNVIEGNSFTGNGYDVSIYANNYQVKGNYIGAERIVGSNTVISKNVMNLGNIYAGLWISSSSNTVIEANEVTLTRLTLSFVTTDNGDFYVYHNNFLNVQVNTEGALLWISNQYTGTSPPWDNGYPSGGNYWSDYSSRFPNASEIDDSGMGNAQYVSNVNSQVIDRYPLMAPYNFSNPTIPPQQNLGATTTPTPGPTASAPTQLLATPTLPEFPSTIIALALILVTTIATLLICIKKREHQT